MTIGILPAAGQASRFNGFPKFLLPVPEGNLLGLHTQRMREAGAQRILIGSSIHNAEVISRFRPAGTEMYMGGATLAETVLNAREECGNESVLFGMPDTYWCSQSVYDVLTAVLQDVDVAIALWSIREEQRGKVGQCLLGFDLNVTSVVDKDIDCSYAWVWGAIAWKPSFWDFVKPEMSSIGDALQPYIDAGNIVRAVPLADNYYDCGTFEQYAKLCSTFVKEADHATI